MGVNLGSIKFFKKGGGVNDVLKMFGWYLMNCFFCFLNFISINELFVFVVI